MRTCKSICLAFLVFLFLAITGCGGGGGGSASSSTGALSLSLTDSTTDQYSAVYVTIKEVQVNVGGEGEGAEQWQVVASPNKIYDLLTLVNGVMENLGVSDLPTGHYTQMRLIIGEDITVVENRSELNLNDQKHEATGFANYIITKDDNIVHELKIPSGYQTGIKLVHEFDIVAGLTADLILDFEVAKSVVERGKSGMWNLKPTIKVLGTNNIATLAGIVTDDSEIGVPIAGASVSAQIYNPTAADEKDKVIVATTTLTASDDPETGADESGQYKIYLKPGEYIIVATATGYISQTAPYTAALNAVDQQDFALTPAGDKGTLSGTVQLANDEPEFVTISFRQTVGDIEIEVASLSMGEGGQFSQMLPYGDYKVVLSMTGHKTQSSTFTLATATLDIGTFDFTNP